MGDGRSYGDVLVMLLPPSDKPADEYDPDVRMLTDDAADRLPWLGAYPLTVRLLE